MSPGDGLVVEGAGLEASVQDGDKAAGQPAQGVVVVDAAGAQGVVAGAGAGGCGQGGEGLRHEGVGEPVVAGVPGGDDLFLPEARVSGEVAA